MSSSGVRALKILELSSLVEIIATIILILKQEEKRRQRVEG